MCAAVRLPESRRHDSQHDGDVMLVCAGANGWVQATPALVVELEGAQRRVLEVSHHARVVKQARGVPAGNEQLICSQLDSRSSLANATEQQSSRRLLLHTQPTARTCLLR